MYTFNPDILPEKKDAYIVGGSIRDLILGQQPTDYDIAVKTNAEAYAKKLAHTTFGKLVELGKEHQKIFRIITKDHIFDISTINGPSIQYDVMQRDFTINAMAYSFYEDKLIDVVGGTRDLDEKSIRMVSKYAFKKDPIRLLRAYRIAAALDFEIEPHTISTIKENAFLLMSTAEERITEELFKLLETSNSYHYLIQMIRSGLLFELFPELKKLQGCCQNTHHALDVFEHTLFAYKNMEMLFRQSSLLSNYSGTRIPFHADKNKKALMKYAILLHDIGKPCTKSKDFDGNIHFYGHGPKSADMAKSINRKLKLSNKNISYIDKLIRNHSYPMNLYNLHIRNQLKAIHTTRFFIKFGEIAPDIVLHGIADQKGKGNKNDKEFINFALQIIKSYYSDFKPEKSKPPLLNGNDLISIFALTPSPVFKRILDQVEECRLSGQIKNRQQAVLWVKNFLNLPMNSNP